MRLSSKLRSSRQTKLTPDLSYLEQTSELSQKIRNGRTEDLTDPAAGVEGVSNLQMKADYGGISHGALHILGQAAMGALGGVMGGLGGGGMVGYAPMAYPGAYGAAGQMGHMQMGGYPMGPHPGMGARMVAPVGAGGR